MSSHVAMDHSKHENQHEAHHPATGDNLMMMMSMSFHGGCNEVILFSFWKTESVAGLIGSMVAVFLMGVAYEGLKFLRENIVRKNLRINNLASSNRRSNQYNPLRVPADQPDLPHQPIASSSNDIDNSDAIASISRETVERSDVQSGTTGVIRTVETSIWSWTHLLLTVLHMVQVIVAYFLMLIFMTYNSWLCSAVIVGAGVGYFIFGWKKTVLIDDSEHCH